MRKKILLLNFIAFIVLLLNIQLFAQENTEKANYRLAERFSSEKIKRMVFSTSVHPNWLETGDKFWYIYKTTEGKFYYIVDLDKKTKKYLFDNHEMARMLTLITKDPYDYQHLPSIHPKFEKDDSVFQFDVISTQDEEPKKDTTEMMKDSMVIDSITKDSIVVDSVKMEKNNKLRNKKKIAKKKRSDKKKKKVYHLEYNLKTAKLYENKDWKEEKEKLSWVDGSISPDSSYCVFAKNFNLYYMDKENYLKAIEDEKDTTIIEHQITTDGVEYYEYGEGYHVSMNDDKKKIKTETEKRRGARVLWSPDSKKFALTRKDNRNLKFLWVINSLKNPRPALETYKYQLPGEKDPTEIELLVFDIEADKVDTIDVKKFNNQMLNIVHKPRTIKDNFKKFNPSVWLAKNSSELYIERQSRNLYKYNFCKVNLETGEIKVLIEEEMNTYIEIMTPLFINEGKEFIHLSERDGWAHFYLYDDEGNVKNQITSGPWHCSGAARFADGGDIEVDEKNRILYFTGNGREKGENPYYKHFYKVNFDGSGLMKLDKGQFNHRASMTDSKKYFVDNYSRVNTVPKSDVRDVNGKLVLNLETADLSSLYASGYKFPEPFKAKAADGITDIYGVMYKPFDFDSTKSYPIIEYVYPGPQTEAVNTSFSPRMDRTDRTAQLGFIVITLGNRGGHPDRSKWYHNYGYGDLRDYGLADKKYIVEQLADKYKFIDIERVGITGHSGGGFMSTAAICQYPDFYKVAISAAGNHDNSIYNRWWSETHHGVKEVINDKDGSSKFLYEIEKNPQLAANLRGKLMLVTGDMDNNVHPGNTIRMANALIRAKKRFDFFIMPGQRHGFGSYSEYAFWLYADYFCKHLLGDYSISTDIFEMRRENKMTPSKKRFK
jgi:dipeptidyl aminopeptidase/acylaminoacyl peptidase